jgi:Protein of unknown function (DUF3460)
MLRLPAKIKAFTLAPALWRARQAVMPLFWKAYKSDVTSFIEELKANKPTLEEEQRHGRNLLWDKRIDRDAQAEYGDAKVPQQPYVYQTKS